MTDFIDYPNIVPSLCSYDETPMFHASLTGISRLSTNEASVI